MAKQIYDVIVIGTGAGGGMAMKTLCEAGLKVCALNAGRRLDPVKDFRNHRMPWEMKFRGFGNPDKWSESLGFMDSEWVEGVWEHEIPFTTAPGTKWMWPRCFAVGGKTNFWGRSSARFGDIDFRAATLDGHDVDWPITYAEIAPYYSRTERMVGVSSTVQNRPSNPDGEYLPPFNFRCLDRILQAGAEKIGVPYLPDRISQLTKDHEGHPACHYCGGCTTGCDTGSFFSTPWRFLPMAEATRNLELRTNAVAKDILVDENGMARGVAYIDRKTNQEIEVFARAVVVAASCLESARILLNSKTDKHPNGVANRNELVGKYLMCHTGANVWALFDEQIDNHMGTTAAQYMSYEHYDKRHHKKGFGSAWYLMGAALKPNAGIAGARPDLFGAKLTDFMKQAVRGLTRINVYGEEMPRAENRVEQCNYAAVATRVEKELENELTERSTHLQAQINRRPCPLPLFPITTASSSSSSSTPSPLTHHPS